MTWTSSHIYKRCCIDALLGRHCKSWYNFCFIYSNTIINIWGSLILFYFEPLFIQKTEILHNVFIHLFYKQMKCFFIVEKSLKLDHNPNLSSLSYTKIFKPRYWNRHIVFETKPYFYWFKNEHRQKIHISPGLTFQTHL